MSAGDYLFYSLVGMGVVFCVLVLLMVVIKVLTHSPRPKGAPAAATVDGAPKASGADASPASCSALAPGSAGDVALYDTDPRDAAMVMAIVADELQKPLNELRFISIKEIKK